MIQREHLGKGVTCREDVSVLDVARLLRDSKKHHVFVLDFSDRPVGIVSTMDMNNKVVAELLDPSKLRARDIMTKDVKVARLEESYALAYSLMMDLGTYSVPGVDKDGKFLGVFEYAKDEK